MCLWPLSFPSNVVKEKNRPPPLNSPPLDNTHSSACGLPPLWIDVPGGIPICTRLASDPKRWQATALQDEVLLAAMCGIRELRRASKFA